MKTAGFIGLGLIGRKRLSASLELDMQINFLCDSDKKVAKLVDNAIFFESIESIDREILSKTEFIFLSLPHSLVLPTLKKIAPYAKNILIEKPLGLNLSEAIEIRDISKQYELRIATGFNYRYLKNIQKLKTLIDSGFFGKIFEVDMRLEHGGRPGMEKEWKLKKDAAGGGVTIDPGVHLFDLCFFLFRPSFKVLFKDLKRKFWESDVEDSLCAILENNDSIFKINVNILSWKNNFEISIHGSEGYAKLTGRGGNYGNIKIEFCKKWFWLEEDLTINKIDYGSEDNSFQQETRDFILNPHSDHISMLSDGVKVHQVLDSLYNES